MTDASPARITEPPSPGEVPEVAECLARAFAADPLMDYFFGAHPRGRQDAVREFFGLLLRARLAMGAPVLVLRDDDRIAGAAMGYGTRRTDWPPRFEDEWKRFEGGADGLKERFEQYERITKCHVSKQSHYYLGVIGIDPRWQGKGAGRQLLESFCALSSGDPESSGVYLETASEASLAFYRRQGFSILGEGDLEGTPLWCLFQPRASPS